MTNKLNGLNILVTRPTPSALELCEILKFNEVYPYVIPLAEIVPKPYLSKLKKLIEIIIDLNYIIFISKNSVYNSIPLIKIIKENYKKVSWVAIGKSTADALNSQGILNVIYSDIQPYTSETLLLHPKLQNLKFSNILIIKGQGGRQLLCNTLSQRGSKIVTIETYARVIPNQAKDNLNELWQTKIMDVIILTSQEILNALVYLTLPKYRFKLFDTKICVISLRLSIIAQSLGFKYIIQSDGATSQDIIQALNKGI